MLARRAAGAEGDERPPFLEGISWPLNIVPTKITVKICRYVANRAFPTVRTTPNKRRQFFRKERYEPTHISGRV